ncbi:inositol oxygenase [Cunninghamella echinulata]|nr:inositol oxygenase [Cunninghamella echinulata]
MRDVQTLLPQQTLDTIQKLTWTKSNKTLESFRDYEKADDEQPKISQFYHENHVKQTLDHALTLKKKYCSEYSRTRYMGIWEVMEILDNFVDESDPDTSLSQIMHSLQSAEAARKDNQPRWMILTALIHDLGKILSVFGEEQWTVVGDTFVLGCQFSKKIVYSQFFKENPDTLNPLYSTKYGIYEPNCGLNNVTMSFGHDEYLYHVCKDYLPREALYIIRFHSFYSWHTEGEYTWFMNDEDHEMLKWVKEFNQYDLYSKAEEIPNIDQVMAYYKELISEFFPEKIKWMF